MSATFPTEYEAHYRLVSVQEVDLYRWTARCGNVGCGWSSTEYSAERAREAALQHCRKKHVNPGHEYFSTACQHGEHGYCVAPVVSREGEWTLLGPSYTSALGAPKNPARCKFCSALCQCECHREAKYD